MIYLIRCGALHKIGYSNSPERRLANLQSANPEKLELVDSWNGEQADEAALHEKLAHRRRRGEWFDLTPEDLDWLRSVKLLAPAAAPPPPEPIRVTNPPVPMRVPIVNTAGCTWCASQLVWNGERLECETCGNKLDLDGYPEGRRRKIWQEIRDAHATNQEEARAAAAAVRPEDLPVVREEASA